MLGDCWFVAAAAVLACRPKLFHVVVPDGQRFDQDYAGDYNVLLVLYFHSQVHKIRAIVHTHTISWLVITTTVIGVTWKCNRGLVLGQLRRVDLIICVRCPSVRPSTKSFSDSDEIWYVGRGMVEVDE